MQSQTIRTAFETTKFPNSSVGRAQPCQGWGREFEPRLPLQNKIKGHLRMTLNFGKLSPDGVQSYVSRPCAQGRLFCLYQPQKWFLEYEPIDLRVEKDLFFYSVRGFLENVTRDMVGPYHSELLEKFDGDYEAIAAYVWDNSYLTDADKLEKFLAEEHTIAEYHADPFFRFFDDVRILDFNRKVTEAEGENKRSELDREFTHALYQMREDKAIPQYPDANSTMRITYGTVGPVEPYDGVFCDWKSTAKGIMEKYNPDSYEFQLNERQVKLYKEADWGRWGCGPDGKTMYVNFLTDNDITGGNSGSPVMNSKGELIGLAFDGNKESLANDMMCVEGYDKCVCVDIRFILWTLDKYAGMSRIIEELGL